MEDNQLLDQQINVELSEEIAEGVYSNLAMIAHSNSEFVIDFIRLMPGVPKAKVKSRIIVTPDHAKRLLSALKENIEKYIELNANLLEGTPNINNNIRSFKDLRYILNKIEINLEIQNEISKLENKSFDNTNYIAILKNKHKIYLEYGFTKWPILSGLRKFKKLFTA